MENLTPVRPSAIIGNTRLKEIKTIKGVAKDLLLQKKQNFDLERKFFRIQRESIARDRQKEKEELQELKKTSKSKSIRKEIKDQAVIKLYDLFKFFAGYKILEWMSKPENIASLGEIAKALKNIFKVIDYFAGIGVEGVLGGLHSVLFGSNFLDRFFGVFKLIGGLFIIKRLLFPGQILKDIIWILKNGKSIGKVFQSLGSGKFKEAIGRIFKLLTPNLYSLFKNGLTHSIKRVVRKVFGRGALKLLTKISSKLGFNTAKQFVKGSLKRVAAPLTKIPLIGPILGFGLNLIFGDPLDKAAVKAIGASIGAWLGGLVMGALGSIVPVAGTAAGGVFGAVVGGLIGDWVGDKLYGFFKGFTAPKEPALAVGGIVTKPTRALIGEAGPEAVIPLPKIYDGTILNAPLAIVGSSMIGGINAVISSLGSAGLAIKPYASQLLAPYQREFGSTNYVFTSDIGKKVTTFKSKDDKTKTKNEDVEKIIGLNQNLNIISKKEPTEEAKKSRYNSGGSIREILADILNNVINLNFRSGTGTGTDGGGGGGGGETGPNSYEATAWKEDPEFATAVNNVAKNFNIRANDLLGLMASESGLNPTAGTHHVGLIQFSADAARSVGTTQSELKRMSRSQQMPYVQKYLQNVGLPKGATAGHLYTAVFLPAFVKESDNFTVAYRGGAPGHPSSWYSSNAGLDMNRDGKITISELGERINKKKKEFGIPLQTGGVVNPIPSQNIATNKGGYAADTGLDILTPTGSRVISPVSGTLEYAEKGHVRQMGQDANPDMPGMQDQHSVRIKLDKPFTFAGKKVNFFYATHLYKLNSAIQNKSNVKINAGDLLGLSGVANNVPHVHVGFVEDRNQNTFLNYQQVRSLLSGAPIQDVGQSPGGPDGPTGSDTAQDTEQPAVPQWELFAKGLAELYQTLNAPQKLNGTQLEKNSMEYVQAFKQMKVAPDTYIMTSGSNIISSTNVLTSLPQTDYSVGSFSAMDSSLAFNLNQRL